MHIHPHLSHYILIAMVGFALAFSFGVSAKEYGVSERDYITGNTNAFSDTQIIDFTVKGGEVIAPLFPIRAYVTVEGTYEGGGSITAYFDGNTESGETFTLLNTGEVENMEFVLGDKLGVLNSSEEGVFPHQLYLQPNGVTITSVSAYVSMTYGRDVGNSCPEGQPSTIKSKTIEMWVANSEVISSAQNYTINYGLNDDLDLINNPISSAYVEIIGLYNSGGVVDVYFNNKSTDGVSHELIYPWKQKKFTILSKDISDLIQKESGVDFTQQMTIDPNGMTLSNVSIRFVLTYQYHPAKSSCGGFPPTGEYIAPVLDTKSSSGVAYNSISWRGELGGDYKDIGRVRFQLATSACSNGASNPPTCNIDTWKYIGGLTCSNTDWFEPKGSGIPLNLFKTGCSSELDGKQYYRYKVQLCAKDCVDGGVTTPVIDAIYISWSP